MILIGEKSFLGDCQVHSYSVQYIARVHFTEKFKIGEEVALSNFLGMTKSKTQDRFDRFLGFSPAEIIPQTNPLRITPHFAVHDESTRYRFYWFRHILNHSWLNVTRMYLSQHQVLRGRGSTWQLLRWSKTMSSTKVQTFRWSLSVDIWWRVWHILSKRFYSNIGWSMGGPNVTFVRNIKKWIRPRRLC